MWTGRRRCSTGRWRRRSARRARRASRKEQALLLSQALDRLSEDYREVIILRHLEGLGFDEVAQRMERSLDSVQKLWVRRWTTAKGLENYHE